MKFSQDKTLSQNNLCSKIISNCGVYPATFPCINLELDALMLFIKGMTDLRLRVNGKTVCK